MSAADKREAAILRSHLHDLEKRTTIAKGLLPEVTPDRLKSTATEDLDAALQNVLDAVGKILDSVDFETGYLKG